MKVSRWIVVLGLCVLLMSSLGGYKMWQIRSAIAFATSFPEHSETVSPERAKSVMHQPRIQVMGEVVMPDRITLRNELPGRVSDITLRPGDGAEKGDILVQMDISEELAKQQSAQARLQLAEIDHRRIYDLRKRKVVSQADLDKAIADLEVVRSELAVIGATIDKKTLHAPFNGTIGLYQIEEGSYLQSNTDIAQFVGDQHWIWIEFSVPQFYPLLEVGTEVTVSLAGQSEIEVPATVIARDPVVSTSTRTHRYRARIDKHPASFVHNASVQVSVPTGKSMPLMEVPLEALLMDEEGAYVYRLHPDEQKEGAFRATRQNVTVFQRNGNSMLLKQGVNADDVLAGIGAFKLQPELLVYPAAGDLQQAGI